MKLMSDINIHLENKKESRHFFVFLWIMYAMVYMTKNCFSGALAAIVAEGSLTLTQTTFISAAFYIVYTPFQILGGIVSDKYSPERLITIGLLGGALSNIVIFFTQNYYVMLVAWVFNAIIQFALWPSVFKIMSSQLVRSDRGQMTFYMSFAGSGGLILTYIVSAFLPDWRYNFLLSAVVLVSAAVVLQLYCKHLNPLMKKDYVSAPVKESGEDAPKRKINTVKLFLISGFFAVLPSVVVRTMVENSTKTFSSTMLMQSYDNVSPTVGNLLNVIIIASGIVGTILIRFVFYPRIIKDEITGYFIFVACSLPFAVILRFIGDIPAFLSIISLCMVSMTLGATPLLTQYYNMNYIAYGKNGTAAGILNAGASLGMVLQNFVFSPIAESLGWNVVTTIWIGMILFAMVLIGIAIRPAKRFKKSLENKKEI